MYDVFMLRNLEEGKIAGYRWDLDDPKKVICIIHGIGEYGGRYDRVAETFREAGYAVYAMDLRGHGISLGKRGHCAPRRDVLEDIDAYTELLWKNLNEDNKISLYVRYTALNDGSVEHRIVNKHI